MNFRQPRYTGNPEQNPYSTCARVDKWYTPALVTASMIGRRSAEPEVVRRVLDIYSLLEADDYVATLMEYYSAGIGRYDGSWRYSDIVTTLWAACELLRPSAYLEIGVRRGRSMAVVGSLQPDCHIAGFDNWKRSYAGLETPGPEFVREEMKKVGFHGKLELVSGNSHETVPEYLAALPDLWLDLVTVDGDHTPEGAADDLANILPRLKVGGAVVFDDIVHPAHPQLHNVWRHFVEDRGRFSVFEYTELGYGVAVAVRKA